MEDSAFFGPGEIFSLLCAFFWAAGVILFRKTGEAISPLGLNMFKNIVGFLLFLITLLILGHSPLPRDVPWEHIAILLLSGVLGIGVADTMFLSSLNRIGATNMGLVEGLYSPFVVIFAFFYLQERPGIGLFVALSLMLAGIIIGSSQGVSCRLFEKGGLLRGFGTGILSVAIMSWGIVMAKPVLEHHNIWWASGLRLFGAILFLCLLSIKPKIRRDYASAFKKGPHWKVMLPACVTATYLGMAFWIAGMKYSSTSVASVLNQSSILLIPPLAAIFLKETIGSKKIIALGLGFAGVLILTLF